MPNFDISLSSKKPILLLQQIYMPNHNNSTSKVTATFVISTVDKLILIISIVEPSYTVLHSFSIDSPATAVFYNPHNDKLVLGCADGTVCQYHCGTRQLAKYTADTSKCQLISSKEPKDNQMLIYQIICVYAKYGTIFAFTLNSQILMFSELSKQTLALEHFPSDITASLIIKSSDPTLCIAFNNSCPPFLFDCKTAMSLLTTYASTIKAHAQNENVIEKQISDMVCDSKACNKIVCCLIEVEGSSCICVFGIEESDGIKLCQPELLIEIDIFPISMHLNHNYLTLCSLTHPKVYHLPSRSKYINLKKADNICWCFLLALTQAGHQNTLSQAGHQKIVFMSSKGINIWSDKKRKTVSDIHIEEFLN